MSKEFPIAEIFGPTIQGEGPHVGMKTIFVRVCGCDFNCEWCDSKFAWTRNENTKVYTEDQLIKTLIELCKSTYCNSVTLTGGNPCLYDFEYVIRELQHEEITIDVETQGSKLPDWLRDVDCLVISPKAPSSKQIDVYDNIKKFAEHMNFNSKLFIKIPVFNDEDIEFCKKYYKLCEELYRIDASLYISVGNENTSEEGNISNRILTKYEEIISKIVKSDMKKVFILPQVHTLVWGNKQGV